MLEHRLEALGLGRGRLQVAGDLERAREVTRQEIGDLQLPRAVALAPLGPPERDLAEGTRLVQEDEAKKMDATCRSKALMINVQTSDLLVRRQLCAEHGGARRHQIPPL